MLGAMLRLSPHLGDDGHGTRLDATTDSLAGGALGGGFGPRDPQGKTRHFSHSQRGDVP
jgi:hypothetical protein